YCMRCSYCTDFGRSVFIFICFHSYCHHPHLHSFPTRRSSDLSSLPLAAPSPAHPFGTDSVGRDTLARMMYGGRVSLLVGLTSMLDRKSTRLNSSHVKISYAVFCLKKKTNKKTITLYTCAMQTK